MTCRHFKLLYSIVVSPVIPPTTHTQSLATRTRLWYLIDARGQVVGRLASMLSLLLQGKTKPVYHPAGDLSSTSSPLFSPPLQYSSIVLKYWLFSTCTTPPPPHPTHTHTHTHTHTVDMGDHVVVINTRHLVFTGNKWDKKLYRHHTGLACPYPHTQTPFHLA